MKLAETIVTGLGYLFFLTGMTLFVSKQLRQASAQVTMKRRLREKRRSMMPEHRLHAHFRTLLEGVFHRSFPPLLLECFLGTLFLILLLVSASQFTLGAAALISLLIAALPYLMLRIRLENIRAKSSLEAEALLALFLSQYRIHSYNLYEAMESTVHQSQELKHTGRMMYRLLLALRSAGDPQSIRRITDEFSNLLRTNWSRMMATQVRIAAVSGVNISMALEDILIQLRDARVLYEERRRLNGEAVRMTLFLVPLLYLATVTIGIRTIGLSPGEFLQNQFLTQQGLLLFLSILFLFFLNIAVMELVLNQRFDC